MTKYIQDVWTLMTGTETASLHLYSEGRETAIDLGGFLRDVRAGNCLEAALYVRTGDGERRIELSEWLQEALDLLRPE